MPSVGVIETMYSVFRPGTDNLTFCVHRSRGGGVRTGCTYCAWRKESFFAYNEVAAGQQSVSNFVCLERVRTALA